MQVYDVLPDAELRCGTGNAIRATDDGFSTTFDADFDVLNIFKTKFSFFLEQDFEHPVDFDRNKAAFYRESNLFVTKVLHLNLGHLRHF